MAVIVCQHCERENEIPDDELCPGYSELYEALKKTRWWLPLHHPITTEVGKAIAKVESK